MKSNKVELPIFNFDIHVIEIESPKDAEKFIKYCNSNLHIDNESVNNYKDRINNGMVNGGYAFRNLAYREFLMLILPCESPEDRRSIIQHELRHVVDRILIHLHIEDIETPAYITGYLARYIY